MSTQIKQNSGNLSLPVVERNLNRSKHREVGKPVLSHRPILSKSDNSKLNEELERLFKRLNIVDKKKDQLIAKKKSNRRQIKYRSLIPQGLLSINSYQQRFASCVVEELEVDSISLLRNRLLCSQEFVPQGVFDIGLDFDTQELIQELIDTLRNGLNLNHSVSTDSMTNGLSRSIENLTQGLSTVGVLLVVIVLVLNFSPRSTSQKVLFAAVLAMILSKFGCMSKITVMLYDFFSAPVRPQGILDYNTQIVTLVTGLLNMYLFSGSSGYSFRTSDVAKMINAASKSNGVVRSVVDSLFIVAEFVRGTLELWFEGEGSSTFVSSGYEFIDDWLKEVDSIRLEFESKRLLGTDSAVDRLRRAIGLGESYARKLSGMEFTALRMSIHSLVAKLEKIKVALLSTNFQFAGVRREPVALLLRGSPGCGKSLAMQHIADALMSKTLSDTDFELYKTNRNLFIYNRQSENVYWEGYDQNKRIIFFDDLLQMRDVKGSPDNEIMAVIRAINVFENQLHCAAIESKGNTLLRADWIIANTNVNSFDFESISDPAAFLRRWDVPVKVCPRPEFCENPDVADIWHRRVDVSKLPVVVDEATGKETTRMHPDQLEFHLEKKGVRTFIPTGQVLNFQEFISHCSLIHETKVLRHTNYLNSLEDTLRDYRVERYEEFKPQMDAGFVTRFNKKKRNENREFTDRMLFFRETKPNLYLLGCKLLPSIMVSLITQHKIQFALKELWLVYMEVCDPLEDSADFDEDDSAMLSTITIKTAVSKLQTEKDSDVSVDGLLEDTRSSWKKYANRVVESWQSHVYSCYTFCLSLVSTKHFESVSKQVQQFGLVFSGGSLLLTPAMMLKYSALAAGFVVTARLTLSILPLLFGSTAQHVTENLDEQSDLRPLRAKHVRSRRKNVKQLLPQGVLQHNSGLKDLVNCVVKKNMFAYKRPLNKLERGPGATHVRAGFAIGVKDRLILMPYHYLSHLQHQYETGMITDDDVVCLQPLSISRKRFVIPVPEFLDCWVDTDDSESRDIALIVMPPGFQPVVDITGKFVTEKQLTLYSKVDSVLVLPRDGEDEFRDVQVMRATRMETPQRVSGIFTDDSETPAYYVTETFRYMSTTTAGDCGGMLIADDRRSTFPLLGFHVAGIESSRVGISNVISQEFLKSTLVEISSQYTPVESVPVPDAEDFSYTPQMYINVGVLAKSDKPIPSGSGKTKILPSPLHNKFGFVAKTAPSVQRIWRDETGALRDPYYEAMSGYCENNGFVSKNILKHARVSLQQWLTSKCVNKVKKITLTFDEAVKGDDSGYFSSIPRVTSAGYPWVTYPGLRTKERFFGVGDEYDLENPECDNLRRRVSSNHIAASHGQRVTYFFIDCLKDERRPLSKVKAGQTRLFSTCPADLLILSRMLFGSFQKHLLSNAISMGVIIGINEYSTDWDLIARNLLRFGKRNNIGAGDFKGFDKSISGYINMAILKIINDWYGNVDGNNYSREILWLEVTNSMHLFGDIVTSWSGSLGSGHPLTIIVNTLHVMLLMRLAWIDILGAMTINDFNIKVELVATGDDHVFSVHESIELLFTERHIAQALDKIGYKYIPEDKEKLEWASTLRNIEDVTYLKRKFVYDNSLRRWVAPLDIDVIMEIPYWVKDGASSYSDVEANIRVTLCELSIHGKTTFLEKSNLIRKAVESVDDLVFPCDVGYEGLRDEVLNRGMAKKERYEDLYSSLEAKPQMSSGKVDRDWLPGAIGVSEIRNNSILLHGREERAIQRYSQGAPQANPVNPREFRLPAVLVQAPVPKCTNDPQTTSNQSTTAPQELGQVSGTYTTERMEDLSSSIPANSTTIMSSDGDKVVTKSSNYVNVTRELLTSPHTGVSQEIRDFLAKPYQVASGVFQATDTVNMVLSNPSLPSAFISPNVVFWKLAGNFAFRGTCTVTLVLNANRFQQGRYILAWIPDGGGSRVTGTTNTYNSRITCLTQVTQLPHVEMDLNCDTEVSLEIPTINAVGWYPVHSTAANIYQGGVVALIAYSPLVTNGGSTSATWTMYSTWRDVEFCLPAVPQSGRERIVGKVKRRKRPEETEQQAGGPISGVATAISAASKALAGVPFISSIAGEVGWAADIVARVASAFGWSKYHLNTDFGLMVRYIMPRYNNADTGDTSTKLSVFDKSSVKDLPGFSGTDLDEMSISYIASIPAYYTSFTWSESDAIDASLWYKGVDPRSFVYNGTAGGVSMWNPTPIAFVSNFFGLWRGSIKFTFKIVKTEFHTGRLLVCFNPYDYGVNRAAIAQPSVADSVYLHREIIDVRYGDEFSFVVPYASLTPYRPTISALGLQRIGGVSIYVLNPLVAPANVSSSVNILVEVSAGPDFEVAQPRDVLDTTLITALAHSGSKNACEISSTTIGNAKTMPSLAPSEYCIGERVLSMRTLVKRFNSLISGWTYNSTSKYFYYLPWSISPAYISGSSVIAPYTATDVYAQLGMCYALARGSMRYKIFNTDASPANNMIITRNLPVALASSSPINGNTNFNWQTSSLALVPGLGSGSNNAIFSTTVSGGAEVEFPYYNGTFATAVSDLILPRNYSMEDRTTFPPVLGSIEYASTPSSFAMARAAGEDFSFGLFVCTPTYNSWVGIASIA
jgi:hypothetical protein